MQAGFPVSADSGSLRAWFGESPGTVLSDSFSLENESRKNRPLCLADPSPVTYKVT